MKSDCGLMIYRHLDRRKNSLDFRTRGFHPRRKAQMIAELFQFFVQSKTGRFGRDFKEHTAGLAEINGMKVNAIDYWCHVVTKSDQMFSPLELLGIVSRAKSNMMHRTRRDLPHPGIRQAKQINDSARWRVHRCAKAKAVSRFLDQKIAEAVRE